MDSTNRSVGLGTYGNLSVKVDYLCDYQKGTAWHCCTTIPSICVCSNCCTSTPISSLKVHPFPPPLPTISCTPHCSSISSFTSGLVMKTRGLPSPHLVLCLCGHQQLLCRVSAGDNTMAVENYLVTLELYPANFNNSLSP